MPEGKINKTAEQYLIDDIKDLVGSEYIGDDCAILPGGQLVSTDTLVENTHFVLGMTSLADLGWKAVAVNLSDIAAMGGSADYLLIAITMPPDFAKDEFRLLFAAMSNCAAKYGATVIGGDITRGERLIINITVIGHASRSGPLKRSYAKAADVVFVTGNFGSSAAGLLSLQQNLPDFQFCKQAYLKPHPRLAYGLSIADVSCGKAAVMDASDGLADALIQLCWAGNVGMDIDLEMVPVHDEVRQLTNQLKADLWDWVLYGGEDYELVGTICLADWKKLSQVSNSFISIGRVTDSCNLTIRLGGKVCPALDLAKTFQHLTGKGAVR